MWPSRRFPTRTGFFAQVGKTLLYCNGCFFTRSFGATHHLHGFAALGVFINAARNGRTEAGMTRMKGGASMASRLSISKERTAELIKEYGKGEGDSGSAEVQVAILTERIRNLTEHLKVHKKDNHTRRGLMMLIGKRRGMLKYIKDRDIDEYRALIKKLGIRDNI